ncbi:hypothetical protein GLAREA_03083 [Glarea lozoyensis ATCC 20868]|uniref:Uncharacterized protein n=1 Tax=Glarea lozoyensis (strain ATCC 20868 / MF5171) TaxID=1116229 RepID=S3CPW0_GLAL2|nr:uncharacterized protein GLAREA_03083 [Glarea lozoyensis ATCC 20868]EPE27169.1 hypothetical protein GLAREA_03083 [Glarea lozoyensis ATCC 20868]
MPPQQLTMRRFLLLFRQLSSPHRGLQGDDVVVQRHAAETEADPVFADGDVHYYFGAADLGPAEASDATRAVYGDVGDGVGALGDVTSLFEGGRGVGEVVEEGVYVFDAEDGAVGYWAVAGCVHFVAFVVQVQVEEEGST